MSAPKGKIDTDKIRGDQLAAIAYPPDPTGIPVITPQEVRESQAPLEKKLRAQLSIKKDYDVLVGPVLDNLAALVHLLPASQSHHHKGLTGLYRHSLEVALYAVIATENVVMVNYFDGTPQSRRDREIRWRVAAAFAGLTHDIGKVATDMLVTSESGEVWQPYLKPLYQWCLDQEIDHYYVGHRANRNGLHENAGSDIAEHIWTQVLRQWFAEPGPDILATIHGCVSGLRTKSQLGGVIKKADMRSTQEDLARAPNQQISAAGVSHLQHVIDAMRRLIQKEQWKVNTKGARVWVEQDGPDHYAYVAWRAATKDINKILRQDKIHGVPQDPATLAEILVDANQAILFSDDEGVEHLYWRIRTRNMAEDKSLVALKVPADLIFPNGPPAGTTIERVPHKRQEKNTEEQQPQTHNQEQDANEEQGQSEPGLEDEKKEGEETSEATAKDSAKQETEGVLKTTASEPDNVATQTASLPTVPPDSKEEQSQIPTSGQNKETSGQENSEQPSRQSDDSQKAVGTAPTLTTDAKPSDNTVLQSLISELPGHDRFVQQLIGITRQQRNELYVRSGNKMHLLWPDLAEHLEEDRNQLLNALKGAGWLRKKGLTYVHKTEGKEYIVLKPAVVTRIDRAPVTEHSAVKSCAKKQDTKNDGTKGSGNDQAQASTRGKETRRNQTTQEKSKQQEQPNPDNSDNAHAKSPRQPRKPQSVKRPEKTPKPAASQSKPEQNTDQRTLKSEHKDNPSQKENAPSRPSRRRNGGIQDMKQAIDHAFPPGKTTEIGITELRTWLEKNHPELNFVGIRAMIKQDYSDMEISQRKIRRKSR